MSLSSYSSIFNLGHRAVQSLLQQPVHIEEKVDGSQFSFGVYGPEREFKCRSKGAIIEPSAPPGLFAKAVEYVQSVSGALRTDWTYRGEVLAKPKHNVLAYERAPAHNVIIWDIDTGGQNYLQPEIKVEVARELGLECAPCLFTGSIGNPNELRAFLDHVSVLGGQKIEGIVIKPAAYDLFGTDKKLLIAKLVSEDFKEIHSANWKNDHKEPTGRDVIASLGAVYGSPARWQKAVIHLREAGLLVGEPRDIALLVKEIPLDVEKECADEIKQRLFEWCWPQLRRAILKGLPEYYKEQLIKNLFEVA